MSSTNHEGGFTLIETLIASAVFGIVMIGAFTLYASNQDAYRRGHGKADARQNARVALHVASREIRIAGFDPSGTLPALASPTAIQVANQGDLAFVADVNRDGILDRVSYRLQGSRFLREISSWDGTAFPAPVASELADGVSLLVFNYFDDTTPVNTTLPPPVAATDLGDIRRISVSLVASATTVARQETFPLVTDIRLRN